MSVGIIERLGASEFWERNREHGPAVLVFAAGTIDAELVTASVRGALSDVTLVDPLLIALSETVQVEDWSTHEFLAVERRFSEPGGPLEGLPSFVPADALCAAIERRWPDGPRGQNSDAERLALEFGRHRCS